MTRARLHLICGNCGCNDQLSFEIVKEGHDISGATPQFLPAVWIRCGNCVTIHNLSDCMPETVKPLTGKGETSNA